MKKLSKTEIEKIVENALPEYLLNQFEFKYDNTANTPSLFFTKKGSKPLTPTEEKDIVSALNLKGIDGSTQLVGFQTFVLYLEIAPTSFDSLISLKDLGITGGKWKLRKTTSSVSDRWFILCDMSDLGEDSDKEVCDFISNIQDGRAITQIPEMLDLIITLNSQLKDKKSSDREIGVFEEALLSKSNQILSAIKEEDGKS